MIDSSIHEAGEHLDLPYRFKELGSWRIASELIRRHPEDLLVIETHPCTGQYDCLSIYRRNRHDSSSYLKIFLQMNRARKSHVDAHVPTSSGRERPNWLDVMMVTDLRRHIIVPIEESRGMEGPSETPVTTSRSIGVRLIAEILQIQVHHSEPLTAHNGMEDSSGMGGTGVRESLFRATGILDQLDNHEDDDLLEQPAYRFWFVKPANSRKGPIAAIDVRNGLIWTKKASEADLLSMYDDAGRSVVRLATLVVGN